MIQFKKSPFGEGAAVSTAKRYVLCKLSNERRLFVGGDDPGRAIFHRDDLEQPQRFKSIEEALDYRRRMRRQLYGGSKPCGVYELIPEGQLIDVGV
jgi:hypothetical protein